MATDQNRRSLIIIRRSPYGSSLSRAALDTALAMAAFDQPVNLLFIGDGILHLLEGQDSRDIGVRNIGKLLGSLPLYDIESVSVDEAGARTYQLQAADSPVPVQLLDAEGVRELMGSCDHLMGF